MHRRSSLPIPTPSRAGVRASLLRLAALTLAVTMALLLPLIVAAAESGTPPPFVSQVPRQRVYDTTGAALTPEQAADVQARADALASQGVDTIIYIQSADISVDQNNQQARQLMEDWDIESRSGAGDGLVIFLSIVPPGDHTRVSIYDGATLQNGNLPTSELSDVINDVMIPKLKADQKDVYGSLTAGMDRLAHSQQYGPPRNGFEKLSDGIADSVIGPTGILAGIAGLIGGATIFRRRQVTTQTEPPPTTTRPGTLPAALAAGLVDGTPPASGFQATLLEMATNGAVAIEPEHEKGWLSEPTIQVRLLDQRRVRNPIEQAAWQQLSEKADSAGVVSSGDLRGIGGEPAPVRDAVSAAMREMGWLNPAGGRARSQLYVLGMVALILAVIAFIFGGTAESVFAIIGAAVVGVVGFVLFVMGSRIPRLSIEGQDAALPWKAYRTGIQDAGKDEAIPLDLNVALPDAVAMGLGKSLDDRLKAAGSSGAAISAFGGRSGSATTFSMFPYWVAFNSSTSSPGGGSGSSSSTIGGGSGAASGGGGAGGSS